MFSNPQSDPDGSPVRGEIRPASPEALPGQANPQSEIRNPQSTTGPDPHRRFLGGISPRLCLISLAAYCVAAAYVVWLARDRINPDAIAYMQNARHYAAGRFDLAVNGWFGPMISWLLVPSVWLGLNAVISLRVINALSGVVLAVGAGRLAGQLAGGRWQNVAFLCALLLGLGAAGDEITPDLLLAAGIVWYLVASYRLQFRGGPARALAAGLLGGLCYAIKMYGLVFVLAHLAWTFFCRLRLRRRGLAEGRVGLSFAGAVVGVLLTSLPWVVVISKQAGYPCLSTIGRSSECWGPLPVSGPLPVHMLQQPREGRLTGWENPAEIHYPWPRWEVSGPMGKVGAHLKVIGLNLWIGLEYVLRFDRLGLLFLGWLAACVSVLLPGARSSSPGSAGRAWACGSAVLFFGGFIPIWVVSRYLWGLWGMLPPIFASMLVLVERTAGPVPAHSLPGPEPGPAPSRGRRVLSMGLAALLLASVAHRVGYYILFDELGPAVKGTEASRLRRLAEDAHLQGRVAANRLGPRHEDNWYRGLFTTFWAASPTGDKAQFLGQFDGRTAEEIAEELCPYGPSTLLLFDDPDLYGELEGRPEFRLIVMSTSVKGPPRVVHVLQYRPAGS